jgi:DNA-binding transcriptional MerR regulator
LTTAALEKRTGVPRTTIYFYIRQGLLPEPQRTATGRSLFGQQHVDLLWKIGELKHRDYSLPEIKKALSQELEQARETEVDLEQLEIERMRSAIIEAASEEFEANGYKGTHVMAIIQKMDINPHIFYRYFPSKLDLLLECFKAATPLPLAGTAQDMVDNSEIGENVVRGLTSDSRWVHLSGALTEAVRAEGSLSPDIAHRLAQAWDAIIINVLRDFERARRADAPPLPVPQELLAYSMFGAYRSTTMRASWDERFTAEDLMRTQLFLFFAIIAAVSGEVDLGPRMEKYGSALHEAAAKIQGIPPAL